MKKHGEIINLYEYEWIQKKNTKNLLEFIRRFHLISLFYWLKKYFVWPIKYGIHIFYNINSTQIGQWSEYSGIILIPAFLILSFKELVIII